MEPSLLSIVAKVSMALQMNTGPHSNRKPMLDGSFLVLCGSPRVLHAQNCLMYLSYLREFQWHNFVQPCSLTCTHKEKLFIFVTTHILNRNLNKYCRASLMRFLLMLFVVLHMYMPCELQ